MKLHNGAPLYSATDLLTFLGCTHATALDYQVMSGALGPPTNREDEYLDILKEKGLAHERSFLDKLRNDGRSIFEIERDDSLELMAERTRKAMRDGVDVIYQGALTAPGWHGYSDFLLKVDTPSELGAYSYEVADTKLARSAKPKHVVQLCVYSDILAGEQRIEPVHAHVMLGDGTQVTLKLRDFIYYCRRQRERFTRFMAGDERSTVAERCPHCSLCHWGERCDAEWESTGNLRLVAGITSSQAKKLRASGVTAIHELAVLADGVRIPRMQDSSLTRLRSQARLQMVKRTTGQNRVELLPPLKQRGFERLPLPNEGDLFFDMEGDPVFSPEGSLEYLFGFHYVENGDDQFKAIWACDRAAERKAFEDTVDFIMERLEKYPDAYIYHYASYEQTALRRLARDYGQTSRHEDALKRLAQQYGTRENEVDDLLRKRKMVDLYRVIREAVQTSQSSYSLKDLEVFFAPKRTQEITGGGDSIVAFERWLKCGDDALLEQIGEYNRFDCLATRLCRDWLIGLRPAGATWFDPSKEQTPQETEREGKRRALDAEIAALRHLLVEDADPADREWRDLLGCLLDYHRREARSEWWEYYKRLDPATDLVEDGDCIGSLTVDTDHPPRPDKRSMIWRLSFPEQEFKLDVGDEPVRTDTKKVAGEIVALNEAEQWLELRVGPSKPPFGETVSLIPPGPLDDRVMRDAIRRYAEAVIMGHADKYPAVTSILRRQRPRLHDDVILRDGRDLLSGSVDAVTRMNHTHLVIQGPPGSGKTFTSAHAIVALLESGNRIGVTSLSHKAINNLLREVERVATERGVTFTGAKLSTKEEHRLAGNIIEDVAKNDAVVAGDYQLVGGTAWLFAQEKMEKQLEYLFIDEAGQVSLANVVATGLCAHNVVLVGDQMQLPQPTKGKHPGGSGVSGLEYLMGDAATVPADRGIFLSRTWRMHPRLCRFVSDAFYDGRLEPDDCTALQMLHLDDDCHGVLTSSGLRFVAVGQQDNAQKSTEEAERLDAVYRVLLRKSWVNQRGDTQQITTNDILVVSPYNMQVNLLKRTLPAGARVGTVDKFQGQEAAAVLISMASSSAERIPRGIEFLFSPNRLNVALSRSRCLAVLFCSPSLLDLVCSDLKKMVLLNTVCCAEKYSESLRAAQAQVFVAATG